MKLAKCGRKSHKERIINLPVSYSLIKSYICTHKRIRA